MTQENKHDFKAALKKTNDDLKYGKSLLGHIDEEDEQNQNDIYNRIKYLETIQFALEFTDRALNGEVSGHMAVKGIKEFDLPSNVNLIFEAMTAQLANEVAERSDGEVEGEG